MPHNLESKLVTHRMRHSLRSAGAAIVLAVTASVHAGPAPGKPAATGAAIARFTFEKDVDGWIGFYDDPATASPEGVEGARCLMLKTDRPVNREYVSPMFPVQSGRKYRISARVRVEAFGRGYSPLTLNMLWFLKPAEKHNFGGWNVFRVMPDDAEKTFGWKRVEAVIEIPRRDWMRLPITHARIQVRNYRSVGTAYVDDIRVEIAKPDSEAANRDSRTGI